MASMAMTASFLPVATKQPSAVARRGLVVAKASTSAEGSGKSNVEMKQMKEERSQGRRELVAAAVTVAAAAFGKVAMADEPKAGTAEAKQKYGPICVTMPTARICHK